MIVVSILPRAEFGPNDYWKDAPHFICRGDSENIKKIGETRHDEIKPIVRVFFLNL